MATHRTMAQVEAALRNADGQLSVAARALGVKRQSLHQRIARSPHLQELIAEIDADLIETAEGTLAKAIRAGDMPTVRWYLDRKGRNRGYGAAAQSPYDPAAIARFLDAIGPNLPVLRAIEAALEVVCADDRRAQHMRTTRPKLPTA